MLYRLVPSARRRRLLGTLALALVVSVGAGFVGTPADTAPSGALVIGASVPVYSSTTADAVWDSQVGASSGSQAPSTSTYVFTDPMRHRVIEVNRFAIGYGCPASQQAQGPQGYQPAQWAAYDLDSYALTEVGCGLPSVFGQETIGSPGTYESGAVVDPTSGLVLIACRGFSPGCTSRSMILTVPTVGFSKGSSVVGGVCAGSAVDGGAVPGVAGVAPQPPCTFPDNWSSSPVNQPYQYIHALSWYAPTDDVLAVTDNAPTAGTPVGTPGVAVTDYHIAVQANGSVDVSLQWTEHILPPLCTRSLDDTSNWTGAAYRSEDPTDPAVFVACTTKLGAGSSTAATSVVKIPLSDPCPDGAPLCAPHTDPLNPAVATTATAPFPGQGWMFDPQGERGYLIPDSSDATGLTLGVYDGHKVCTPSGCALGGSFIGRFVAAGKGALPVYGLDRDTGRVYVDESGDPHWGLTLVDGRRTPVTPYSPFTSIQSPLGWGTPAAAVAPPDSAYPYTRLFLPLVTDQDPTRGAPGTGGHTFMRHITVVADRLAVSQQPPPGQADAGTYTGAVPPGATLTTATYSTFAEGYGVHSVTVGGYGGLAHNNDPVNASELFHLPFDAQSVDLALGAVGGSALRDGVAQAVASAAFDVNGNGEQIIRACTDASAPQSCSPPNCAIGALHTDPCNSAYSTLSGAEPSPLASTAQSQSTGQDWPYPAALCSQPGPDDLRSQTVSGIDQTPFHSASPDPSSTPSPPSKIAGSATTSGARAAADCSNGQASALGQYQCSGAPAAPDPSATPAPLATPSGADPDSGAPGSGCTGQQGMLTVAGAWTTTHQLPPVNGVVESDVTATAYGIHLALPDGTVVDIQKITQTAKVFAGGQPGTAHTQRNVALSNITVLSPGQTPLSLCVGEGQCNPEPGTVLDALNSIDPSHIFVTFPVPDERFGVDQDGVSPKGSPGGYTASVQANPGQAQGDDQINGMRGFGGGESKFVPALRIVLFNPGDAQVNRQLLDFAGVEADAQLGTQLVDDGSGDGAPVITDTTQEMIQAGYPPSSTYVPGSGPVPNFPGVPTAAATSNGLLGVLERALSGISWLIRSPLAGLQMAAFLVLLGVPFLMMRRRWTWRTPHR